MKIQKSLANPLFYSPLCVYMAFSFPSAGYSPAGQYSGSNAPRQSIQNGSVSTGGNAYYTVNPIAAYSQPAGPARPAPSSPSYYTTNPAPAYSQPAGPTNPNPAPAPSSSTNSGFNMGAFPGYAGWDPAAAYQDWLKTGGAGKQAVSQEDEVNNVFNDAYSRLDTIEKDTRAGEQNFYDQYTKPIDALRPELDQSWSDAQLNNSSQKQDVNQREANAFADARRLFDELRTGSRQRFGGSSSMGEFANAFLGREQQRQMGQVQNTAGQDMRKLSDQYVSLKKNYDAQVQGLGEKRAGALAQAKTLFDQKISEINSMRFGLDQNKAQAKLQALRDLQTQAQNIENTYRTYGLQLQSQLNESNLNLRNAVLGYKAQAGQQLPLSQLSITNPLNGQQSQFTDTGAIQPMGQLNKRPEDQLYQGILRTDTDNNPATPW